jgi:hypothetical protein
MRNSRVFSAWKEIWIWVSLRLERNLDRYWPLHTMQGNGILESSQPGKKSGSEFLSDWKEIWIWVSLRLERNRDLSFSQTGKKWLAMLSPATGGSIGHWPRKLQLQEIMIVQCEWYIWPANIPRHVSRYPATLESLMASNVAPESCNCKGKWRRMKMESKQCLIYCGSSEELVVSRRKMRFQQDPQVETQPQRDTARYTDD